MTILKTGMVTSNTGVTRAMVEVPETGIYRSKDGQSRFYRAGTKVDQHEFDLLQMGGSDVIGEPEVIPGTVETKPDGPDLGIQLEGFVEPSPDAEPVPFPEGETVSVEVDGETVEGVVASIDLAEPDPEAKAEPKPKNKKEPNPSNKSE